MSKSVIIDAVRSPIGVKNGSMIGIRPDDLTAQVYRVCLIATRKLRLNKSKIFHWAVPFRKAPKACSWAAVWRFWLDYLTLQLPIQ